ILLFFVAIILNLTYLQIFASEKIVSHPKNTRGIERELLIPRGSIVSADGEILAKDVRMDGKFFRNYPFGEITAHLIGFNSVKYGRSGVEAAFNDYLLGKREAASIKDFIDQLMGRQVGYDLELTLNAKLQRKAAELLWDKKGAIVALNPKTGEILAMASNPTFNPNNIETLWKDLNKSLDAPLLNRATQGLYPPGSTFKIITAAAALEEKVAESSSVYEGPKELPIDGSSVTNFKDQNYGVMTLKRAFEVSCNTVFAQVGLELTADKLIEYAEKFGFNKDVPFELPSKQSKIGDPSEMDAVMLAWSAVGQGETLATPLRVALVVSVIANDGKMMKPFLVKEIRSSQGQLVKRFAPQILRKVLSQKTTQKMIEFMVAAVEGGTGRRAKIEGVTVAGKTGTAEAGKGKEPHAWFVAFAPAEDPQIVIAVVVENGGIGGKVAAPIARELIESFLK
ncbi:MAG: penicillin-binding transpeptidase domain-containing protein, partial [Candidatus Subteraquimicrobiales bacterium]|nr:penicillin-binding transpeptidase domain-containing protein [Candidatus Subteraquimicrobiales bacterium]